MNRLYEKDLHTFLSRTIFNLSLSVQTMPRKSCVSPHQQLLAAIKALFHQEDVQYTEKDLAAVPRRWESFDDFILFPADSLRTPAIDTISHLLWPVVAEIFHVSRIGRHGRIKSNDFRSPRLQLLLGQDTWVRKKENGVIYELDLAHSMFSSGNGTEKARMMGLDCVDEIVVDLFAGKKWSIDWLIDLLQLVLERLLTVCLDYLSGIGYFTIPLLKAKVGKVYACEWNPDAVKALRKNLDLNGVRDRCEVLFGDNRQVQYSFFSGYWTFQSSRFLIDIFVFSIAFLLMTDCSMVGHGLIGSSSTDWLIDWSIDRLIDWLIWLILP